MLALNPLQQLCDCQCVNLQDTVQNNVVELMQSDRSTKEDHWLRDAMQWAANGNVVVM
jgi:hypothetical protein